MLADMSARGRVQKTSMTIMRPPQRGQEQGRSPPLDDGVLPGAPPVHSISRSLFH